MLKTRNYLGGNIIKKYLEKTEQNKLYKRTLFIIVLSQTLGGLGLSAGITVGALIAKDLLGADSVTGLPTAIFTLGSSLAAYTISRLTQTKGRRGGLSTGFLIGGLGALGVIFSTAIGNVWLLFIFLFIYGFGSATNLQARYAGTDLTSPEKSSTAISTAMVATTFGAVLGPNLSNVMANIATALNLPTLTGSFILSAFAYLSSGLVIFFLLKPDPYLVAEYINANQEEKAKTTVAQKPTNMKQVIVGVTIMVVTQIVMIGIMTMTPIHMQGHGHDLGAVGIVIGIHIGSMYLPSLVTGKLVEKIGAFPMAIMSGVTLIAAALVGYFAPGTSMLWLAIALALLGLGWNFGLISGTTILVQASSLKERAKIQGISDIFIALGGTLGGAVSGVIVASFSYGFLALVGGIISLVLIIYVALYFFKKTSTPLENK